MIQILTYSFIIFFLCSPIFAFLYIWELIKNRKIKNNYKQIINEFQKSHEITINSYKEKYKDIISIEKEVEKKTQEFNKIKDNIIAIQKEYLEKHELFLSLSREVKILQEDLDDISYGFYKPHFEYDSSERYKQEIISIQKQQKNMVKDKKAVICSTEWHVQGSKSEGRKMINRITKLSLRAFNNECDAAVLKVGWNNLDKMEVRIKKSYENINEMISPNHMYITNDFLNLKFKELYLAYEFEEKRQQEKEEQKAIREQIREEQKAQKEAEKARKEAEKEEERYRKALEKAKKDLEKAQGEEVAKLQEQLILLEQQLQEASQQKERAISMAQLTKAGNVYIISNIGSFGKNVFKIGMTRRLEPEDRIRELSSASVPFPFDIHAMISTKNAPELENTLHRKLDHRRVNLVNNRKEFFEVSINELQALVEQVDPEAEFYQIVEAKEYRETISLRKKEAGNFDASQQINFPATL